MFPLRDVNPTVVPPFITVALIVINALVFFLWQPTGEIEETEFLYERAAIACELTTGEALAPAEIETERCVDGDGNEVFPDKNVWLAAAVSLFLHGGIIHLAGNMWFLWIFGNNVEEAFGTAGYVVLYLAAGIAGTAGFVLFNQDSTVPLIGASGAIAGVLGAYLVLFPRHQVLTLIFIIFVPVRAMVFLGIWFVAQFAFNDPSVAWEAHVAGFVLGAIVTLFLRRPLLARLERLHGLQLGRAVPFR